MINSEDFRNPLFLLFLFTLILGIELGEISGKLSIDTSIMESRPILLSENIFETFGNFFLFLIPIILIMAALNQKKTNLKVVY